MPYSLTRQPRHILLTLSGHLTVEDFNGALEDLLAIEAALPVIPDRITVLDHVEDIQVSADEMRHVTASRKAKRFPNRFRSAIVAPDAFHRGYARMFQMLNDHPDITIRIFDTLPEAEAWLEVAAES